MHKEISNPGVILDLEGELSPRLSTGGAKGTPQGTQAPHVVPRGGRVTMHVIVNVAVARGTQGGGEG